MKAYITEDDIDEFIENEELSSLQEDDMLEYAMEEYYEKKLDKKLQEVIHIECDRIRNETIAFEQREASENISDLLGKKRMVFAE